MQVAWKKEGTEAGSLEPFFYIAHLPATIGVIRHVAIGDSLLACHEFREGWTCSFLDSSHPETCLGRSVAIDHVLRLAGCSSWESQDRYKVGHKNNHGSNKMELEQDGDTIVQNQPSLVGAAKIRVCGRRQDKRSGADSVTNS